jgi:thiol-disulfide isomerase/thioredoxin
MKIKRILFVFAIVSLSFLPKTKKVDGRAGQSTRITFKLKAGSQLFISYPLDLVQTKDIVIQTVQNDTAFELEVKSERAFTLLNLNKKSTQYLFFPNFDYTVEVEKNEIDLHFTCSDKFKEMECNVLNKIEKEVGRFNLIETDGDTRYNDLIKKKIYSRALDSFYIAKNKDRFKKLDEYRADNKISSNGFELLRKYLEFSFIRNRFLPFSYSGFDRKSFPSWYRDTMMQYVYRFDDTSLLNTQPFKVALRSMGLFLSYFDQGDYTLNAQFLTAKNFSKIEIVNDMQLYFVMNTNKRDKKYSDYVDSFKIYSKDGILRSLIIQNNDFSIIKNDSFRNILVSTNNEVLSFESLVRRKDKIVIVDFWATWCAPCIKELSTAKNLIAEFAEKDVSFIFISMDEDFNKWKNSVSGYSFMNTGNSYILKNGFESELAKTNHIKSIPFYCVYKNDGTLIKSNIENIQTAEFKYFLSKILRQ